MEDSIHTVLKYVVFPCGSIAFSLWVRFVWRGRIGPLDTPIGLDLHRTAFFTMVLLTFEKELAVAAAEKGRIEAFGRGNREEAMRLYLERAALSHQLEVQMWWILAACFGLWVMSELVSRTSPKGTSEVRVHLWYGLVIPVMVGLFFLLTIPTCFLP